MRRISYWPYVFLALFYLGVMGTPLALSEYLRTAAVCSFSPGWKALSIMKDKIICLATAPLGSSFKTDSHHALELEKLKLENQLLHSQFEQVRQWLLGDDRMEEQYERLHQIKQGLDPAAKGFFKRRSEELCQRLSLHIQSMPARVIFREPASWSSSLWIDVGEQHNEKMGKCVIGKNSPVLFGTSIIGVVEKVGKRCSCVRLITDARLHLSVRALRGKEQNRFLYEHLDTLLFALELRQDLFAHPEEAEQVFSKLAHLKHKLSSHAEDLYLAKGELSGSSCPLWRSRGQVLKGVGFNYDFADEEGPARDLRTGEPYDPLFKKEPLQLLRSGDILVTTGLDGICPAGLRVATVCKVHMLQEGASSYEIEAVATAGSLDEITHVVVLPPQEGKNISP